MAKFPTPEWLNDLNNYLNNDEKYAQVAHNWEGDMKFIIEPSGALQQRVIYYIDLWYGKCRGVKTLASSEEQPAAFTLKGTYDNFSRVMKGELDPMQAMLTRKLNVQGSMMVMMKNVPTVMNFVRCCRENTDSLL